jgi:hypothetical protein
MGNLFFFHWQHKGSKKRESRPQSINSSNIQNRRRPLCLLLRRRLVQPPAKESSRPSARK